MTLPTDLAGVPQEGRDELANVVRDMREKALLIRRNSYGNELAIARLVNYWANALILLAPPAAPPAARPEESDHEQEAAERMADHVSDVRDEAGEGHRAVRRDGAVLPHLPEEREALPDRTAGEVALGISPRLPLEQRVEEWRLKAWYGDRHEIEEHGFTCNPSRTVVFSQLSDAFREALRDAQQQRTELEQERTFVRKHLGLVDADSFGAVMKRLAEEKEELSRLTEARDRLQSRVDDLEGIIRRHNRG